MSGMVRKILAEKLAVEVASDDADLLVDGALDSVTLVQLILHLEQSFGIRIDLAELEIDDLRTVHSIARLVEKLQTPAPHEELVLAHSTANVPLNVLPALIFVADFALGTERSCLPASRRCCQRNLRELWKPGRARVGGTKPNLWGPTIG